MSISSASAILAHLVFASPAWTLKFGRIPEPNGVNIGWLVECARGLGLLVIVTVFLGSCFRREARVVMALTRLRWWRSLTAVFVRTAFLSLMVGVGYVVILYHVSRAGDQGPMQLAREWWTFTNTKLGDPDGEFFREFQVPYLYYLPYSMVNYLVVDVPLFVVCVFAGYRDFWRLRRTRSILLKRLSADGSDEGGAYGAFRRFRHSCSAYGRRYLNLLAAITLYFLFEYSIGNLTLSFQATLYVWVALALTAATTLFVGTTMTIYDSGFQAAMTYVSSSNEASGWIEENKPYEYMKSVFLRTAGGTVLISLSIPILVEIGKKVFIGGE